jgi:superfamily I DNA/RNA helicase
MTEANSLRVSYDIGCMRSVKKLPPKTAMAFLDMMAKVMSDPSRHGLNIEPVQGSRDKGIKSVRIDQGYRAIGYLSGQDLLFLHVDEHDDAYRWASNRAVRIDPQTRRIRIVHEVPVEQIAAPVVVQVGLFNRHNDRDLLSLGILPEELPVVRAIINEADLDARQEDLDVTSHEILVALAAGYGRNEILTLLGSRLDETEEPHPGSLDLSAAIESDEGRQTIFIPETEAELRKFLEGDLEGWRVFLHRDQRRFAYRDYNGPVLIRGGAGTGKTVVAMHRAKFLADQIAATPTLTGKRVLLTTFTTNLARDIEANLGTLCPQHLDNNAPRIEVINLDAWVSDFLKRRKFGRKVAYFSEEAQKLKEIWREVFDQHGCPEGLSEGFIRAEWAQVIQARGIDSQKAYFKISRAGRGTPLDRKKRAALWVLFEDYRARLLDEGLAEPDDAYREAITLIQAEAPSLPYSSVIIDEAQDMGEQAFRLIRAIVPLKASGDRNSIFIVGDAHQRIYARKASMSACGVDVRGRSRKLKLNYRTTDDIRRWSVAILEGVAVDDLDDGIDSLKDYTSLYRGPKPGVIGYGSVHKELDGLNAWLRQLVKLGDNAADIGVLVRTNRQVDQVAAAIEAAGLPVVRLGNSKADDRTVPGVRVTTMHRAKGLEFYAVAVPLLSSDAFPGKGAIASAVDAADRREIIEREKALLHVAATRAKKELRISWSGQPSELLPS